jgi:acyl-CoA reductase-like NAD-dependent aldehyde dehydrogenase
MHHGQICFSTERIIVHKEIAEKFIPILLQKAKGLRTGHGATLDIVQKAHDKLTEASEKGATFLLGRPQYLDHANLVPTFVQGVTKEMSMWDEETFGPSASIFVAESDDDAVGIANDSKYGLNAAIHTMDTLRAIEVGRRLEVAQVHVNALTEHDEREYFSANRVTRSPSYFLPLTYYLPSF